MKGKRKISLLVTAFMMMLSLAGCGNNNRVRIGTGGVGGNYYSYGTAVAPMLEKATGKSFVVKETAGSAANIRLISDNYLEMAIVQSDILRDAYTGTGTFEANGKRTGYSAVAGLYLENCQVIVSADSGIKTIEDLYGKRVSLGEEESGVLQNARQILMVYGLNENMIDASYMSFTDSAKAMKEGRIDAFFCTASAPTTAVSELAREKDINVISLDEKAIDRLINEYEGYTRCTIKAGTYMGQDEEIVTVGVKAVLIASDKLDADTVEAVLKCLFENSDQLSFSVGGTTALDLDFATSDISIPFHDGAAAYYKKQNVDVKAGRDAK